VPADRVAVMREEFQFRFGRGRAEGRLVQALARWWHADQGDVVQTQSAMSEQRSLNVRGGMLTEVTVSKAGHLASSHNWIQLEPQPDNQTVVVKCHRCGVIGKFTLPKPLSELVDWLDQIDRDHKGCPERAN